MEFENHLFAVNIVIGETSFHVRETVSSESTYCPVGTGKISSVKQD